MKNFIAASWLLLTALSGFAQNSNPVKHFLTVQISPSTSHISVTDSIINLRTGESEFSPNASFTPISFSKNVQVKQLASKEKAKLITMTLGER